jgi:hypothetical protein
MAQGLNPDDRKALVLAALVAWLFTAMVGAIAAVSVIAPDGRSEAPQAAALYSALAAPLFVLLFVFAVMRWRCLRPFERALALSPPWIVGIALAVLSRAGSA